MLLDDVVRTSAAVAAASGRLAKIELIARLLGEVPPAEITIAASFLSGDLTQRQIGVGYAALSDLTGGFGQASAAGPEPADGPEPAAAPQLTLTDTDQVLGQIGQLAGPGSQAERRVLLAGLLARATAPERQFLVRLVAGELRQGALDGVMTDAIARAAGVPVTDVRRAYQLSGSLPAAATTALTAVAAGTTTAGPDPADRARAAAAALAAVTLQIGRPVGPMLAASAPTVAAALERVSPAAVEWKIDGIRVQLHRSGDTVRVFSRTLDDITARVPELAAAALTLRAETAVLDGEAVALRPDGRPRPFQVTSARAASQLRSGSSSTDRDPLPLSLFLFDVLHLDGQDLIDAPASDRFARLADVTPPELLGRALRRGPARQRLDQGKAAAHPRPGRPRGRVGARPPPGLAVQPAPGRP
jgi:DNA ligase-1